MGETIRCVSLYLGNDCWIIFNLIWIRTSRLCEIAWNIYGDPEFLRSSPRCIVQTTEYDSRAKNRVHGQGAVRLHQFYAIEVLKYCDRMGWQWGLAFLQPGTSHTNQRKMLRRGIGPQRLGGHNPIIERITAKLMLEMREFKGNPLPLVLK
jgi:hypothetical protein